MNRILFGMAWFLAGIFFTPGVVFSQEGDLFIRGGEIHTISGAVIVNGAILIRDGKIAEVAQTIQAPEGITTIDATGMIVTPGIIDARTTIGAGRSTTVNELMMPARKLSDTFKLSRNSQWLNGGVTTAYIAPAPRNLLGGFGAVVKLAGTGEDTVVKEMCGFCVSFGESVTDAFEKPTTKQGMVAQLRQEFVRAQEYMNGQSVSDSVPEHYAVLIKVLKREVRFRVYVNTPDDIMTALRIAKKFNFDLILDGGAGAHLVADKLAQAKAPVIVGASIFGFANGGPYEMYSQTPDNAGLLHKAGVQVALSTNSRSGRSVLLEGVVAKGHGLPEEHALKAITLNSAEILGVSDRLGSIESGKDGDIVIWKNHPLSTWGESQTVIINGRIVFQR